MAKKSKRYKRRLVVIAGPSCSGKSWLIKQIRSGNPSKFVGLIQKKCKIKGNVLANRLRLSGLRKDWRKYGDEKIKKRLKRGAYLHFDVTGRQQTLKRTILHKLMNNSGQVIVLNIVMSFEQWIEVNALRMAQEPECSISAFVKGMLKLNEKNPMAARRCYTYAFDRWQQYLESSPLLKCITMESRQETFIDQIERDRLGLVKLTRFQLAWLKIRYGFLLFKVA